MTGKDKKNREEEEEEELDDISDIPTMTSVVFYTLILPLLALLLYGEYLGPRPENIGIKILQEKVKLDTNLLGLPKTRIKRVIETPNSQAIGSQYNQLMQQVYQLSQSPQNKSQLAIGFFQLGSLLSARNKEAPDGGSDLLEAMMAFASAVQIASSSSDINDEVYCTFVLTYANFLLLDARRFDLTVALLDDSLLRKCTNISDELKLIRGEAFYGLDDMDQAYQDLSVALTDSTVALKKGQSLLHIVQILKHATAVDDNSKWETYYSSIQNYPTLLTRQLVEKQQEMLSQTEQQQKQSLHVLLEQMLNTFEYASLGLYEYFSRKEDYAKAWETLITARKIKYQITNAATMDSKVHEILDSQANVTIDMFKRNLNDVFDAVGHPSPGFIFIIGAEQVGPSYLKSILGTHPLVHSLDDSLLFKEEFLDSVQELLHKTQQVGGRIENIQTPVHDFAGMVLNDAYESWELVHAVDPKTIMTQPLPEPDDTIVPSRYVVTIPNNALIQFFYINLLFPKSTYINVTRDPVDSVFSIFKNKNENEGMFDVTNSLDSVVKRYRRSRKLISHWQEELRQGKVFKRVRYEDIMKDPVKAVKVILKDVGIPNPGKVTVPNNIMHEAITIASNHNIELSSVKDALGEYSTNIESSSFDGL